jgi:hypothetical protein
LRRPDRPAKPSNPAVSVHAVWRRSWICAIQPAFSRIHVILYGKVLVCRNITAAGWFRVFMLEVHMTRFKGFAAVMAASAIVTAGVMATATPAEAGRKTGFQNSKLAKYGYAPRGYYGGRAYHGGRGYYGGRGYNNGAAVGLGIAAGLLGVGVATGAFGQPAYAEPVYQQPAYGYGQPAYGYSQPVYYRQPVCRIRHRTVWDPYYGYVQQPVQVCR